MTSADRPGFDPVLLDLSNPKDYQLLVNALEHYAKHLNQAGDVEREFIRKGTHDDPRREERWRADAARVQQLRQDIERQLDANVIARLTPGSTAS